MRKIAFSIVLPCYNEAQNLPLILEGYRKVWRESCELVLVNNGSTDNSAQVLGQELAKKENTFARSVLVPVNQGYGYGVMAGVRAAKGEVIGISHADMQCPPTDLFCAYDLLGENKNAIVKGKRGKREFSALVVTVGMATIATSVLMMLLTDVNAQPKVFPRSLVEYMTEPPNGFELDLYILYSARKLKWKVLELPVVFGKRAHGTSKWAFSLASRRRHMWATLKYIFRLRFSHA
jgi:glycosyltransferase involved in cell wall biosynthesis